MFRAIRCLAIASLASGVAFAGTNVWTPTGPEGGLVRQIVADPTLPDTLYAAGNGGVWKSVDAGAHWSPARAGITEVTMSAVAVDRSNPNIVYAASILGGGVFKSVDGGATWNAARNGLDITTIASLAIDPVNSATVYAGTACCGIYKSSNGGASWTWLQGSLPQVTVSSIVIDPSSPSTIYAGTQSQGVYKSTNGGATWTAMNSGLGPPFNTLNALAIDPSSPATLFAATNGAIYRTTNGGASWAPSNGALVNPSASSVVINPQSPAVVYVSLATGNVQRSVDGGATWSSTGANAVGSLAIDPRVPDRVYGGSALGVYATLNTGASWARSNVGLFNVNVQAIAADPSNEITAYVGTDNQGVWKTTDSGATWSAVNSGINANNGGFDIRALAVDPGAPSTVYAGSGSGMYKSVNGGATWAQIDHGTLIRNISAIVINGPVIRVSTFFTGVFVSMNGGDTWTTENQGLPTSPLSVRAMASDGSNVLAATVAPGTFAHDLASTTWQSVGSLPANTVIGSIGVVRFPFKVSAGAPAPIGNLVFVGGSITGYINLGLFDALLTVVHLVLSTSADAAPVNVWQPLPLPTGVDPATCPPIKAIIGAPTPGSFYAGGGCGVLRATNSGQQLAAMNAGMPPSLQVNALALTPSGSDLYAGTQGGSVMRYTLGAPAQLVDVVEYYNATLDHYFITWVPAEQANLDAGNTPTRWTRTGFSFKAYNGSPEGASPVCRYYIPPLLGDSHFFGRGTQECVSTGQKNPSFTLESSDFMQMYLPVTGVCPAGTTNVYRVFSNRADANHRYMTDKAVRSQMVAKGWLVEGDGPDAVVMCAPTS